MMQRREEEIGRLVRFLQERSAGFTTPKMVVIGGYALRAHVPFSRYSRDCDFAMKDGLDRIRNWQPNDVSEAAGEVHERYGFMRWIKRLGSGKRSVRVGLDFMAGEIRGREGEVFVVDDRFLGDAVHKAMKIGKSDCQVFVPAYADLLVMKVVSARQSDVRDVAAMVWKNGVPDVRASLESLNDPRHFFEALRDKVLPGIRHKHFIDSWRGMFVTQEFGETERNEVVVALKKLLRE